MGQLTLDDVLAHGGLEEIHFSPEKFKDFHEELRELCRTDLFFLGKAILGWEDMTRALHGPMCRFVESPPSRFTLLMAFRGSLKSTIGTIGRTIQLQLRKPCSVLIFSEGSFSAEDWSRKARAPFEDNNKLFSWLFPELIGGQKSSSKWGDSMWQLPHGGRVQAAGIDSQLMGAHVNHLIMDDIFSDPANNKTPEYAERVLNWVEMSLPLLVNPARDYRYLTGVPWWTEGEPYAHYRKEIPPESQFVMPFELPDGSFTWPERIPPDELEGIRKNPWLYASQYLLNPVSSETAVFKQGSLRRYDEKPAERNYTRVATLDPSFSEKRRGHQSALVIADVDAKGHIWIEHALKKKAESHEIIKWVFAECVEKKVQYLGVECNGPQIAFFQQLKRTRDQYPLRHPVRSMTLVELRPVTDKIARWTRLASGIGAGQVSIRNGKELQPLVIEMYRVTGAKHEENDLTDAAAHLVGPEMTKKKPMRLTEQSEDAWLPHALQSDPVDPAPRSWMAS